MRVARMAEAFLSLMEAGDFGSNQPQHVRTLLNAVRADADVRK